ncbi:MAG: CPBP family intramembrane metalloprotease [Fidelibacterota bacterium]|nr:MAG: CPBP family intramembrane metalloprotease [Candidatus Neomarinimicrobiota bacterium]
MIKKIFLNLDENRLRAGWRLLLVLIALPIVSRILNPIIKPVFGGTLEDDMIRWIFRGVLVVITATLVVWIGRRYLDKKTFSSLGVRLNGLGVWDLLVGFLISGLMVGIVFVVLRYFEIIKIQEIGWDGNGILPFLEMFLWLIGVGATVAWSEELGFRGYILQNLGEGIGIVWAVVVSCLLYGLMHMINPNSTMLSGLLIAMIGFLRILGWLRTGQLWLSMGMHAGWNFFQGPIFGFSISGYSTDSLIKHSLSGPDWVTGGSFGPEAGIVVVPVVLLGLLAMVLWTSRRENTPWTQRKNAVV